MFCQKCKKEILTTNKFCPECGKKVEELHKTNQQPYWIALIIIGITGIISWKMFDFALPLYIGGFAFLAIPAYLAYKSREFNYINWILYAGMASGFLINFFTNAMWALYLMFASIIGLVLYSALQEDKKMTPEQKEHEFKTAFYDVWKKRAKREGKFIDQKEDELYKEKHSEFNAKNTLTVILPLAVFVALRGEFGIPMAIFIGLIVGGVVRFLYSFFEKNK